MVYIGNIQGSALYDATLGDEGLIAQMFEEAKKKQSSKRKVDEKPEEEHRPPRRGYSREVEALYDVVDNVVALRGEMGRWASSQTARVMTKRPWFPAEKVDAMMRSRSIEKRDSKIAEAMDNWRKKQRQ